MTGKPTQSIARIAVLAAALAGCTSTAQLLTEKGRAQLEHGDLAAARESLVRARAAEPAAPMPAYLLARVEERGGDYYRARDWYRFAATRSKDVTVSEGDREVSLSVWALADLERVGRVVSVLESGRAHPPAPPVGSSTPNDASNGATTRPP